jgi:hypothetical protein
MSALFERVLALHDDDGNVVLVPREALAARELVMLGLPDGGTCLMERGELLRTHVAGGDAASAAAITRDELDEIAAGLASEADDELVVLRCPDGGYYVLTSAVVAATRLSSEEADELRDVAEAEVSGFAFAGAPAAIVGVRAARGLPGIEITRVDVQVIGQPTRAFSHDNFVS